MEYSLEIQWPGLVRILTSADKKSDMGNSADKRLVERHPFRAPVTLSFRSRDGLDKRVSGMARDITDLGLQVEVAEALEVGSRVRIEGDDFEPAKAACVRYCQKAGDSWQAGIALERDLVWSKQAEQPAPGRIVFDRFGKPVSRPR